MKIIFFFFKHWFLDIIILQWKYDDSKILSLRFVPKTLLQIDSINFIVLQESPFLPLHSPPSGQIVLLTEFFSDFFFLRRFPAISLLNFFRSWTLWLWRCGSTGWSLTWSCPSRYTSSPDFPRTNGRIRIPGNCSAGPAGKLIHPRTSTGSRCPTVSGSPSDRSCNKGRTSALR